MTSLFQQISQSANADHWERFRLLSEDLNRLLAMAPILGLSVEVSPLEQFPSVTRIRGKYGVLCVAEIADASPSPFNLNPESYSVAFTDSEEAMREFASWIGQSTDGALPDADSTSHPAPLAVFLQNEERTAWLALECMVLHTVQSLNQLDLEGEPLFVSLTEAIREILAPDLLVLRLENPEDFWPGKPTDWCWLDVHSAFVSTSVAITPRLQRLLYRRERSMFVEDLSTAPDIHVQAVDASNPFKSCFLLPLAAGEKPMGVLMLFYARDLAPLPGETEAVELLRLELSNLLDRNRTHLRMQRMATVDGLTNLFNHRFFHDQLRTEFQRALRYNNMMAVIMVDIDHFKGYNDTYGHLAGDRVLSETARTIRGAVRDIDFVARYGGEEFALILPEVDAKNATLVAEKIRKAVEAQRFISEDGEAVGSITISCGITDNSGATGPDDLISRADRALYWVKRHGRNRVRMSVADGDE